MNISDMPIVKATLSLSGKNVNLNTISETLGIVPTRTRTNEEWPQIMKTMPGLPESLRPCFEWSYSVEKKSCIDIEEVIDMIMEVFEEKIELLNRLKDSQKLHTYLEVVIHSKSMEKPAIGLTRNVITFLYTLDAEVSMNVYDY